MFLQVIARLSVRLMEQQLEERGKKDRKRGEEESRTPRAIAPKRHLEHQAEDGEGCDDAAMAWNMCQRVHKYSMWCDANCQALDTFHVDEWSRSDAFLLVIMCVLAG